MSHYYNYFEDRIRLYNWAMSYYRAVDKLECSDYKKKKLTDPVDELVYKIYKEEIKNGVSTVQHPRIIRFEGTSKEDEHNN